MDETGAGGSLLVLQPTPPPPSPTAAGSAESESEGRRVSATRRADR